MNYFHIIVILRGFLVCSDVLMVLSDIHVITYTSPTQCDIDKYYDIAKLSCESCASGEQSLYQVVDSSGCACKCKPGYRFVNYTNTGGIYCLPCPFQEVASLDGLSCTVCDETNPYNNETRKCDSCSGGQVEVDRQSDGNLKAHQCVACKSGTQPDKSSRRCIPCLDPLLVGKNSCDCSLSTHELVDGICFHKADVVDIPDKESLYIVKYDTMELNSAYFCQNIRSAFAMCQIYRNASACQLLGNLCSLLFYRHIGEEMNACTKYLQLTTVGRGTENAQWPPKSPWLYYQTDSVEDTLHKKDIDATYNFKKGTPNSRLNFTVASYTFDGHFLNLKPINGKTWQLCPAPFDILNSAFQFGTRYHYSCKIPVRSLWDEYSTIFYDPYLYYETHEKGPVLYAVPVLVQNYVENGKTVNRGPSSQWKFFRRFFIVDNISARSPCHSPSSTAKIVRYAKDLTIRIEMYRSTSDVCHIYAPIIRVDYGEATLEDYQSDRQVEVSFSVLYKMDQTKEEKDFSIATGILCSFAIIFSAVQTWCWSKRSGRLGIDMMTLIKLLLYLCGNLATVFLTVTFFTCIYIFLFFKKQDAVYVILPTEEQEFQFIVLIIVALCLKLVHLLHILVMQSVCDVFFVDWERPVARRTILHPKDTKLSGKEDGENSVSIWRTYLVANEWAELQSLRKFSIGFQILASELFLVVVGFENLASADSSLVFWPSSSQYLSPTSVTCRLAIGIAIFSAVALVQAIFVSFIYEQFIEDKIKQYVDLCSISNVSVFVMTAKHFGYYIHGRSVHGHADTDMSTMYEQLRREEDNLCSQRGLLPNSDHQTFQMALPLPFRLYYDQVMAPILQSSRIPGRLPTGNQGVGNINVTSESDRIIQAYQTMNRFLSAFLEHALRDLDYIVKEKSFAENILDIEFQDPTEKGYFYQDSGHSYDSCLLYGHEFTLIIFDLLLFVSIDLAAQDFVLAGIITFVIDKVVIFIYKIFSKRNLARKTLVDARFLI